MAERKKVEKQEVKKVEPKKRVVTETKPLEKPKPVTKVVEQPKPVVKVVEKPKSSSLIDVTLEPEVEKRTRSENKYIRIHLGASAEEKFSINEKIKKGEIKFAFYAIDGEKGYFYYIVNKK